MVKIPRDKFSGSFTDAWVKMVPTKPIPKGKQVQYWENQLPPEQCRKGNGLSLVLSISYGLRKTWSASFYEKGPSRPRRIGTYPDMSVQQARIAAARFQPNMALAATKAGTFQRLSEEFIKRHVEAKGLRSRDE